MIPPTPLNILVPMDFLDSLLSALSSEPRVMLATIISTSGSTPASALSKMIVTNGGTTSVGTIGGGCMEGDVLEAARKLYNENNAAILTFHLNETEMIQGLICGGTVHVLLEPVTKASMPMYEEMKRIRDEGEDCIAATVLKNDGTIVLKTLQKPPEDGSGEMMEYWERTGKNNDEFSRMLHRALRRAETQIVRMEDAQLILEPVFGRPQLVIFGGGHVSRYISRVASTAGFHVTVVDDRPEYANRERFPEADETLAVEFYEALNHILIKPSTYVIIVTRGHREDESILEQVITTPAKYIAMIGSTRKVLTTYEHLVLRGIPPEELKRVHAPMGLDIGATTAEEIAVSVVAEMIQVRRGSASPAMNKSQSLQLHINRTKKTS